MSKTNNNPKPYSRCGHIHPKTPLASELIAYLELIWQDQIKRFPELRPAFIRFDKMEDSNSYVRVRFAGVEYLNGERYHDVTIRNTLFNLEAEDLIQAVLHCVVHCLNYDRGVSDYNSNTLHGRKFKETAEEVGLETFWTSSLGYMTKIGPIKSTPQYKIRKSSLKNIKPYKIVTADGTAL